MRASERVDRAAEDRLERLERLGERVRDLYDHQESRERLAIVAAWDEPLAAAIEAFIEADRELDVANALWEISPIRAREERERARKAVQNVRGVRGLGQGRALSDVFTAAEPPASNGAKKEARARRNRKERSDA